MERVTTVPLDSDSFTNVYKQLQRIQNIVSLETSYRSQIYHRVPVVAGT
jgi:hypothetical protein